MLPGPCLRAGSQLSHSADMSFSVGKHVLTSDIQLLSNLQNIATTTLIGALPSPLSQALPVPTNANATPHILAERSTTAAPSDPAASAAPPSSDPAQPVQPETIASADVGNAPADRLPTIEEITAFAERQANLEFNRREAIRVSAKTVLDVLGKR